MNCNCCNLELNKSSSRWVLALNIQKSIWTSNQLPEIAIQYETVLGYYCNQQNIYKAVEDYLLHAGAKTQWSDVRPIEICACCEEDLDTTSWHQVLSVTEEQGAEDAPTVVDGEYPARFCTNCVPL